MCDKAGLSHRDNPMVTPVHDKSAVRWSLGDDGCTVSDAAALTGLSEQTVRGLLSSGEWPQIKVGHETFVPRFVFHEGEEIPGIRQISAKATRYEWPVHVLARFLLMPRDWIGYDGISIRDHLITDGDAAVGKVLQMVGARS